MRRLIYLTASLMLVSLVGCEKYGLDRQMEELCKKDGGLKIYETVKLPRSAFDATGYLRRQDKSDPSEPLTTHSILSGGEFSITREITVIKAGDPFTGDGAGFISQGRLERFYTVVMRTDNQKILGSAVSYGRAGGGFSLGHPDSKSCPAIGTNLPEAIFKQGS